MNASNLKRIYLAGGCFWGTEHFLKLIQGVAHTQVGYANGTTDHPTYQQVRYEHTGHAETVEVIYDASCVSLETLLTLFFKTIDPTSINRQGGDEGTQYRTGIYYVDADDLEIIRDSLQELATHYEQPLTVEVLPLAHFYAAEDSHQDYLEKHPDGYCHISPQLFEWVKQQNKKI